QLNTLTGTPSVVIHKTFGFPFILFCGTIIFGACFTPEKEILESAEGANGNPSANPPIRLSASLRDMLFFMCLYIFFVCFLIFNLYLNYSPGFGSRCHHCCQFPVGE